MFFDSTSRGLVWIGFFILSFSVLFAAENKPDIKRFLPKDTVVKGPVKDMDGDHYEYFDKESKERVASEVRREGRSAQLDLYKNGKKNGVCREWHDNGQLAKAWPYVDGVLHGVCRHWDEKGLLVGRYKIENGTGFRRVYNSDGRLCDEVFLKNGEESGRGYYLMEDGRAGFGTQKGLKLTGMHVEFNSNNTIHMVLLCDQNGLQSGPTFYCDANGKVNIIHYNIKDIEVTKETYESAQLKDPTLPKFESDPNAYKKMVSQDIWDELAKYKSLKPVKIPLDDPEEK